MDQDQENIAPPPLYSDSTRLAGSSPGTRQLESVAIPPASGNDFGILGSKPLCVEQSSSRPYLLNHPSYRLLVEYVGGGSECERYG